MDDRAEHTAQRLNQALDYVYGEAEPGRFTWDDAHAALGIDPLITVQWAEYQTRHLAAFIADVPEEAPERMAAAIANTLLVGWAAGANDAR